MEVNLLVPVLRAPGYRIDSLLCFWEYLCCTDNHCTLSLILLRMIHKEVNEMRKLVSYCQRKWDMRSGR